MQGPGTSLASLSLVQDRECLTVEVPETNEWSRCHEATDAANTGSEAASDWFWEAGKTGETWIRLGAGGALAGAQARASLAIHRP
jgi:hypothetical protein